jgi:hypothetical protein
MKISAIFSAIFIFLFYSTECIAQNIGIGVTTPLQKLHVGGNVRVDGMAASGTGIITTNANGDLLRTNFSGNANDVLKGNGTFGSVPGTLPSGAMVVSNNSNDANLTAAGFSLYGQLPTPTTKFINYPGGISTQYGQAPIYESGNPAKASAPQARVQCTSVWTGTEVVIWGGYTISDGGFYFYNDGSKYNPSTDTWTPMSFINAPTSRAYTSSVWTGTEVLVWGGLDSVYSDYAGTQSSFFMTNEGSKYNPSTNTWTAMTTVGAPSSRFYSCAVWTGTYMVVWGGNDNNTTLASGGRYNPATNTWSSISTSINAPAAQGPCMFWTGMYVLVLGNSDSIGRYNPNTNTWVASTNLPSGIIYNNNTAIWTGTELWIYAYNTHQIFKYNPNTNTWAPPTNIGGGFYPEPNFSLQSIVWTDSEMVLYGYTYEGGKAVQNLYYRYNPGSNSFIFPVISTNIQYNQLVESDVLFLKAGNVILKWGGSIYIMDGTFGDYQSYSNQGTRIYLTSGISIPTVYIGVMNIGKLYLYQKN